jgi:hypothetical protein
MIIYVCLAAFVLFAFMWMVEAMEQRQARNQRQIRRRLRSALYNVRWEEDANGGEAPPLLRDWDQP